ncbi:carbohydrate ABC transporter permease [Cryptosporangium aurantiacum]|uniref:Carbohydrate ABC transporter membrane protein 2, CUT1 family n=1 Tax=Cryptosporangium aurantiacum TaxID=134849 RepID=A0A1M7PD06_9ACTN|nr:carbohydrate ABC transporter permease [Cryptosporangium aurantiacum]SHN14793.1 carbohydrate ABC transporter membrane protein 2, CUT1 family [Cryptosporangium aurantiacum]
MKTKNALRITALSVIALFWVVLPMWMLLVNSAKPLSEAALLDLGLPHEWALWENYSFVVNEGGYFQALTNSLVVVVPTIVVIVLFGAMAAWAYARSPSMTAKVAYNITVLSIVLPAAILPTIYELQVLGIDGTRFGYFLVMAATRMGNVVFLATGFIKSVPRDLEEAASIDGASKLQIFIRIIFPLTVPVLLVGSVILIISTWNEFFFAGFLLQGQDRATLPLALYQFASASADQPVLRWNVIFAHVVLTSIPLVLVYLAVQRRVVPGLSAGAIKG